MFFFALNFSFLLWLDLFLQATLRCDEVTRLVLFLWDLRRTPKRISLRVVRASRQFQDLLARFAGWEAVVEEGVKEILLGLTAHLADFEGDRYIGAGWSLS